MGDKSASGYYTAVMAAGQANREPGEELKVAVVEHGEMPPPPPPDKAGQKRLASADNDALALVESEQRGPAKKRRKPQTVLSESEYTDSLNHIIRRDFFPTVHAIESMRERHGLPTDTPSYRRMTASLNRQSSGDTGAGDVESKVLDVDATNMRGMALSKFLAKYTSEDNDSFEKLLEEANAQHKEKYWWLRQQEQEAQRLLTYNSGGDDNNNGASHPTPWKYRARNSLMYTPTGDTVEQGGRGGLKSQVAGPKEVVAKNTRFPDSFLEDARDKAIRAEEEAFFSAQLESGEGGITPIVGGYKMLRSPSPMPGAGADSPMMTWGDVVGTPLHLGHEDDIKQRPESDSQSRTGRNFRIPATSKRDGLAWRMAEEAQAARKRRQGALTPRVTPRLTPGGLRKNTPVMSAAHLAQMSPAARLLLARRSGAAARTDSQLRAAYSPAVHRSRKTPSNVTPVYAAGTPLAQAARSTPVANSSSGKVPAPKHVANRRDTSLTDGLL